MRIVAAECQAQAQVGMALFAQLGAAARLRRIHGHPAAGLHRLEVAIQRLGTGGLDHGGELMAEDERAGDRRVPDAGVGIRMQVTPTDARAAHSEQDFAGSWRARISWTLWPFWIVVGNNAW